MGDILSWAADQERAVWRSSSTYKILKTQCEAYNKLMEQVPALCVKNLKFGELQFLLNLRKKVDPDSLPRLKEEIVHRLKEIIRVRGF